MKIVGLQWDLAWEDKRANFGRVEELMVSVRPEAGSLVVLPEMFATGFSMNVAAIAEEERGETFCFLTDLARRHEVNVLAGMVCRGNGGRGCNESVVIDPRGTERVRYRKMHPFSYAGEDRFYESGQSPVSWRAEEGLEVYPLICYDLRFPELFRVATRRGAGMFVVIANWPSSRVEHWRTLLRARAIENQAWVVGVNRCGRDPKLEYPGSSTIIAPQGEVVAELGAEEGWIKAEADAESVARCRADFPFLKDLRADLFGPADRQ